MAADGPRDTQPSAVGEQAVSERGPSEQLLRRFWLGSALIVAAFVALQTTRMFVDVGADGLHYMAARLVAEGKRPHVDFFYGAATGRVLVLGAMLAAGAPIWLTKLVPILSMAGSAVFAGLLALRSVPVWASLVGVLLVAFSSLGLRLAAYQGGHGPAVLLVTAAVYVGFRDRWRWSGALISLALLYDQHAIIGLIAVVALALHARKLGRFVQGLGVLLVGLLALYAWLGDAVFLQTFTYPLLPSVGGTSKRTLISGLWRVGRLESALFALALAAALDPRGDGRRLAAVAWLAFLAALLPLSRTTGFVIPSALLGGAAGIGAGKLVALGAQGGTRKRNLAAAVVALFLISTTVPHLITAFARLEGKVIADERIAALTTTIKARVPPSGVIWGDSAIVPTIAFRGGLRVAANNIDTNDRRVGTGLEKPRELMGRAFAGGAPGVVLVHRHGIALVNEIRRPIYRAMSLQFVFKGGVGYKAMYFVAPADEARVPPTPASHIFAVRRNFARRGGARRR